MAHIGKLVEDLMKSSENFDKESFLAALDRKSSRTYYDIINKPDIGTGELRTIARYFGVPITYFFDKDISDYDPGEHRAIKSKLFLEQRMELLEKEVGSMCETIQNLSETIFILQEQRLSSD